MSRHGYRSALEFEDYGNTVAIWIWRDSLRGHEVARCRTGGYTGEHDWELVVEGQGIRHEPTYRFPRFMLDTILAAMSEAGVEYSGDATVRHLNDAIQMRDRILTLLERQQP